MPHEQRRGCPPQSTVIISQQHRQRSRRRIAAVSFLSNISLDGTHRDTQIGHLTLPLLSDQCHGTSRTTSSDKTRRKTEDSAGRMKNHNDSLLVMNDNPEIRRSISSFKHVPLENVVDANIDLAKPVKVLNILTSSINRRLSDKKQSKQPIFNSDHDTSMKTDQSHINIIVNQAFNPNINANLGNLESNSSFTRQTSRKGHVSNAIKVVTRVRSITTRGSVSGMSITASNTSLSVAPNGIVIDRNNCGDKENIGPDTCPRTAGHLISSSIECENIKEKVPDRRRKLSSNPLALSGGSDKAFSSCESIAANTGAGRVRKVSSSVSESSSTNASNTKEVKYLKAGPLSSWGPASLAVPHVGASIARQAFEGRVLMTTGRGAPLHVFSLVKAKCVGLAALRSDGRKRTVSGSRHLPTITDAVDGPAPPPLAAQHKIMEVSYSNLLVSSMHFSGSKRKLVPEQQQRQQQQQQHTLLGRCFSHDPTVSAGSQSQPPTSYSNSAIATIAAQPLQPVARATPPQPANYTFTPELLDDPELRAGKHRKLLRFPSYMTSLIDYAKPDELKREVNDKFRTKFPHVKITLSKLRSLKREMVHICQSTFGSSTMSPGVTMLTVAHAHAYFDSLCLSGAVEKTCRKPLAGACVMISAKVNDVRGEVLAALIDKIEAQLRVERSELVDSELTALLALKFGVHLPTVTINTHYQRLLFEH